MPERSPTTTDALAKHRLIPVISLPDHGLAEPLGDALVEAGLPCAEVTFRTEAAEASIRQLAKRGDLFVAAGTVLSVEQAKRAVDAGATCLLSPATDPVVIQWCIDQGVDVIPGVATPTEVVHAMSMGLNVLKFFPAQSMGGPSALRAIGATVPGVRFVPTGGITPDNLAKYLELPNVIACGGSWMVRGDMLAKKDFQAVRGAVSQAVGAIDAL